jgi:DNA ligase-1
MLASPIELETIQYPVMVSPKIDGIRCLGTEFGPVSRTLKNIPNKYVRNMLNKALYSGLDGELVVGNPTAPDVFQQTSSGVMSVQGEPDFKWLVFDMWDRPNLHYTERLQYVLDVVEQDTWKWLVPVNQEFVTHEAQLLEAEEECLALGYEGIILRRPDSPYKYGRSTKREQYLLKRKPLADAEGRIIGFEFLEHNDNPIVRDAVGNAKRSNQQANQEIDWERVGAIKVEVINGPFEGCIVSIGTGFTDAMRRKMVELNDEGSLAGSIVTFKYQALGSKDAPRFPSFKGFRRD